MSKNIKTFWRDTAIAFCKETGNQQYELSDLAKWAIDNGTWKPQEKDVLKLAKSSAGSALKECHIVDSKGRHIREFINARIQQKVLWARECEANDEFTILFIQEQKNRVGADAQSLRNFVDHVNEGRVKRGLPKIQLSLNFDEESGAQGAAA